MAPKRDIYGNIKSYFQAAPAENNRPRYTGQSTTGAIPMRPNTNAQSQPNNRQKKPAEGSPEWQKGATKLLADMMSGANIEVSQTLNSPYFAALLRSLNPNFKMPTLEEIQAEQRAAGTKQSEMDEKMTFAEMMEGGCDTSDEESEREDEETLEEREERLAFAEEMDEMENVKWHKCFWGVCPKECVNYGRDDDM